MSDLVTFLCNAVDTLYLLALVSNASLTSEIFAFCSIYFYKSISSLDYTHPLIFLLTSLYISSIF